MKPSPRRYRASRLIIFATAALAAASTATAQELVTNGGFELPVVVGPFAQRVPGSVFGEWTVDNVGQGIAQVATFGNPLAVEGLQSVELNYFVQGGISQTLATTPGTRYQITFLMAGQLNAGPDVKQMNVDWDGSSLATVSWSRSATGGQWVAHTLYATATSGATTLHFFGLTTVDGGPYLDAVSVTSTNPTCAPDFNGDGTLDPDDLADYISAFFAQPPAPGSDFNGDGLTDPDDLADYIGAFFSGCP